MTRSPEAGRSFGEEVRITCGACGQPFADTAWVLVHGPDSPELLDRIRQDTLHVLQCPRGHPGRMRLPLLIYRDDAEFPLLFCGTGGQDESERAQLDGMIALWRERGFEPVPVGDVPARTLAVESSLLSRALVEGPARPHELTAVPLRIAGRVREARQARAFAARGHAGGLDAAITCWEDLAAHNLEPQWLQRALWAEAGADRHRRHARTGAPHDARAAAEAFDRAVALTDPHDARAGGLWFNAATSRMASYQHSHDPVDLDAVITFLRSALALDAGRAVRARALHTLGSALVQRAVVGPARAAALDEAIARLESSLALVDEGDELYAQILVNLGDALRTRFLEVGATEDLASALRYLRQSVDLSALHTVIHVEALNNHGSALHDRYRMTLDRRHLDGAAAALREAVDQARGIGLDVVRYQSNLAVVLASAPDRTPADEAAQLAALEAAIAEDRGTVTERLDALMQCANLRASRDLADDRVRAQELLDRAERLAGPRSVERMTILASRAELLSHDGKGDADAALSSYREACAIGGQLGSPLALAMACRWGVLAARWGRWRDIHASLDIALALADRLVAAELDRAGRLGWLRELGRLVGSAAHALARHGDPEAACQAIERGRARLLTEALGHQALDLDELAVHHADLVERYRHARTELARFQRASDIVRAIPGARDLTEPGALTSNERAYAFAFARGRTQRLTEARDQLAACHAELRAVAKLDEAPRPDGVEVLVAIYWVVAAAGSVALVVSRDDTKVVELSINADQLDDLLVGARDGGAPGLLSGQLDRAPISDVVDRTLPWIGEHLVAPVARVLAALPRKPAGRPPLVLCIATGRLALIPLHTAPFGPDARTLLDDYAVAYAPTLGAWGHCLKRAQERDGTVTVLAVGNPLPLIAPYMPLPFAGAETEVIAGLLGARAVRLEGTAATRLAVMDRLSAATHLHFACHGHFDWMEPLASNLVLSDGDTLRLDALLSNDQLRATRLVVLSACQSGLTDIRDAPEEALSLATGFLHAGAPGVVGSYWSIDDASPMFLMRQFYAGLARLPPAHALREAQLWLRSASHVELAALFREIARVRPATPHVRRLVAEAPFDAEAEADPDGRPFAHPVHWAAFGLCGA